jgi:hypothetical protein
LSKLPPKALPVTRAELHRARVRFLLDQSKRVRPGSVEVGYTARARLQSSEAPAPPLADGVGLYGQPVSEDARLEALRYQRQAQALGVLPRGRHKTWRTRDGKRTLLWGDESLEGYGPQSCLCQTIPKLEGGVYASHGCDVPGEIPHWSVSLKGLKPCENLNCCLTCARTEGKRWAERIHSWASHQLLDGRALYLVTLTVRHVPGIPLARLLDWLKDSWARWRSPSGGGVWDPREGLPEVEFYVRGEEETETKRGGWHPHLHVLLALPKWLEGARSRVHPTGETVRSGLGESAARRYEAGATDGEAAWAADLIERWMSSVRRSAPADLRHLEPVFSAQDVVPVTSSKGIGSYICKIGFEVGAGQTKLGQGDGIEHGRAPLQILRDYLDKRLDGDLALWREYCAARYGSRRVSTSEGVRHPDEVIQARAKAQGLAPAPPIPLLVWDGAGSKRREEPRQLMSLPPEGLASLVASRLDVVIKDAARADGYEIHRLEALLHWHCEARGPGERGRGWVGLWRELADDLLRRRLPPAHVLRRFFPSHLGELLDWRDEPGWGGALGDWLAEVDPCELVPVELAELPPLELAA